MTSPLPSAPRPRPPGPADGGPQRTADLQLRGAAGPLRTRVYWPPPAPGPPGLLVWFPDVLAVAADRDAFGRALCSPAELVVVAVGYRPRPDHAIEDAVEATAWAADHAAELGADARHLVVGGEGAGAVLARAVAVRATGDGWPPIAHLLVPRPGEVPAAAAATVRSALAGMEAAP